VDTISPLQNLRATCRQSDAIPSPYHRWGDYIPGLKYVRTIWCILICGNIFCHCSQKLTHHRAFSC